eukprot:scaffold66737_cov18-Tisochrysis_lutea.AAC.1
MKSSGSWPPAWPTSSDGWACCQDHSLRGPKGWGGVSGNHPTFGREWRGAKAQQWMNRLEAMLASSLERTC